MTDQLTLATRAEQQAESRAVLRLVEAREEFYLAARALGLDRDAATLELNVPLAMRVNALVGRLARRQAEDAALQSWVDRLA